MQCYCLNRFVKFSHTSHPRAEPHEGFAHKLFSLVACTTTSFHEVHYEDFKWSHNLQFEEREALKVLQSGLLQVSQYYDAAVAGIMQHEEILAREQTARSVTT